MSVFRLRDDALEALGLESERVAAIRAWHEGDAAVVLAGSHGNGLSPLRSPGCCAPTMTAAVGCAGRLTAGRRGRVGRGGRIVVSPDRGDTWQPAGTGVDMPMPDMVELFVAAPDDSVRAISSGGRLLRASPEDWSWSSALPSDAEVSVNALVFTMR
jgi:hypothetical protein